MAATINGPNGPAIPPNSNNGNTVYALVPAGTSIVTTNPRVRGLVIGIVSIDDQSALLSGGNVAGNMAAKFAFTNNDQTPSQAWNASIDGSPSSLVGFPKPAVAGLHIDQLYLSIP
jgi:hypothetical protein